MIKHIVAWNIKETGGKSKEENVAFMKDQLESLPGKIPGIVKLEVGIDLSKSPFSGDIILYSEFNSMEDLESYRVHPEHQAVVAKLKDLISDRKVVDYKI